MHSLQRNVLPITLLASALMACARDDVSTRQQPQFIVADMIISVTNQTARNRAIVLTMDSREYPLGVVHSRSSRGFSVPSGAGGDMRTLHLEARERALPTLRSDAFRLFSGESVVWRLEPKGASLALRP